ncbi:MAG: AbrB/MazE/SpoVT family DNA-binding domain-containing protein [Candidatus Bathyarchaeota archaeon]|nr:AbrB/MazE/SpoVT family DNA-binding domain-containing protein [Candidatus Bathyarchaeota archaeon]
MKIAETPISTQMTVYVPKAIQNALGVIEGDVLLWFVEDGRLYVAKKEKQK